MYCTSDIEPDAGTSFIFEEPEEGTIINCFPICAANILYNKLNVYILFCICCPYLVKYI